MPTKLIYLKIITPNDKIRYENIQKKEMYRKKRHPPKDDNINPNTCSGLFSTSPFSDFTFPLGWGVHNW
jgi:hypothetical protein